MPKLARSGSWLLLAVVVAVGLSVATLDGGGPRGPDDRTRDLAGQILCPTCEGQTVRESNAPIAVQIRTDIAERVRAGESDESIRAFYVSRYGPEALATTPTGGFGVLVWAVPVALFVVLAVLLAVAFWRWRQPQGRRALPRWMPVTVGAVVVVLAGSIAALAVVSSDQRVGAEVATGGIRQTTAGKLRDAQSLVRAGEFEDALAIYDDVLVTAPDDTDALAGRGAVLRILGRPDDSPHTLESKLALADLLGQVNEIQEMVVLYTEVLEEDPGNYEALLNRGRAFFFTASQTEGDQADGLLARARADFAAALEARPDDVTAAVFVALAAEATGDLEGAYEQLEALLRREDLPQDLREDVAVAFQRIGALLDDGESPETGSSRGQRQPDGEDGA